MVTGWGLWWWWWQQRGLRNFSDLIFTSVKCVCVLTIFAIKIRKFFWLWKREGWMDKKRSNFIWIFKMTTINFTTWLASKFSFIRMWNSFPTWKTISHMSLQGGCQGSKTNISGRSRQSFRFVVYSKRAIFCLKKKTAWAKDFSRLFPRPVWVYFQGLFSHGNLILFSP